MKSSGTSLWKLLLTLFVGLRLTGYIDWNWFLVCMPVIVQLVLAILAALFGVNVNRESIDNE